MTDRTPRTEAGHRPFAADNGQSYESFHSWTECTCGQGRFTDAEDWYLHARPFIEAEARAGLDVDGYVAAQVRLTHRVMTNPMYPKPFCNHDGEEWPCLTELQVVEGLYLVRAALTRSKP